MATISKKTIITKKKLEKAFKMIDLDGNGLLSMQELKNVLTFHDEAKLKELIAEVDKNGDGEVEYLNQISLKEFSDMMTKFI